MEFKVFKLTLEPLEEKEESKPLYDDMFDIDSTFELADDIDQTSMKAMEEPTLEADDDLLNIILSL